MKGLLFILFGYCLIATACQKGVSLQSIENGTAGDSTFTSTDTLTYEVISKDAGGWYGMWNDENDTIANSGLQNGSSGSAIYFPSVWKYSFVPKTKSFYMFVSVASKSYMDDITINFYRNNTLIKSATNSSMKGVCKLMLSNDDTLEGTVTNPVLTYEVILTQMDSSKYEYNGWVGGWNDLGVDDYNYYSNPLYRNFAILSGWKSSFTPTQLPYTMRMQFEPYTAGGSEVTANFYVNGQLVKTRSSVDPVYAMTYEVQ